MAETQANTKLDGVTIQQQTPDGMMFVTIAESAAGKPIAIWIHIGKAGAPLVAWSHAVARMLTLALDKGATISDIIAELSGITSDKRKDDIDGIAVRSGVEGLWVALMKYHRDKFAELSSTLGDVNERGKGPSISGPRLDK